MCLDHLNVKNCKIPNVNELIKLVNCKLGYRLINKLLHVYSTRSKVIPNLPVCKDKKYHDSYLVASLRDFQALPVVTRELPNL